MKDYLEAGRFNGTHGIRGDIKAEDWCDDLSVLLNLKRIFVKEKGENYKELCITRAVRYQSLALLHIEGFDAPEVSAVLKNRTFYAKREDLPLPDGSFFIADLLGLPVYDIDTGSVYGTLDDVSDNAASQLYHVKTAAGMVYLPAVPEFIIDIDLEKGVAVRPVKGLFDEI